MLLLGADEARKRLPELLKRAEAGELTLVRRHTAASGVGQPAGIGRWALGSAARGAVRQAPARCRTHHRRRGVSHEHVHRHACPDGLSGRRQKGLPRSGVVDGGDQRRSLARGPECPLPQPTAGGSAAGGQTGPGGTLRGRVRRAQLLDSGAARRQHRSDGRPFGSTAEPALASLADDQLPGGLQLVRIRTQQP